MDNLINYLNNINTPVYIAILIALLFVFMSIVYLVSTGAKLQLGNIQLGKEKTALTITKEINQKHEELRDTIWEDFSNKKSKSLWVFDNVLTNAETANGYIDCIFEELFRALRKNHLDEVFGSKTLIIEWITKIDINIKMNILNYDKIFKKQSNNNIMNIVKKEILLPILSNTLLAISNYYNSVLNLINSKLDMDNLIVEDLQQMKSEFETKHNGVKNLKIILTKNNEWEIE